MGMYRLIRFKGVSSPPQYSDGAIDAPYLHRRWTPENHAARAPNERGVGAKILPGLHVLPVTALHLSAEEVRDVWSA